jgi:hypothetical protein
MSGCGRIIQATPSDLLAFKIINGLEDRDNRIRTGTNFLLATMALRTSSIGSFAESPDQRPLHHAVDAFFEWMAVKALRRSSGVDHHPPLRPHQPFPALSSLNASTTSRCRATSGASVNRACRRDSWLGAERTRAISLADTPPMRRAVERVDHRAA